MFIIELGNKLQSLLNTVQDNLYMKWLFQPLLSLMDLLFNNVHRKEKIFLIAIRFVKLTFAISSSRNSEMHFSLKLSHCYEDHPADKHQDL